MSKLEVRRCEVCGSEVLSEYEQCPACGTPFSESKAPPREESNISSDDSVLIIPLARNTTSSEREEAVFIPSRVIEESSLDETLEPLDFLGTGFLINVVTSESGQQYEISNLGNEFLGYVECEYTPSGLKMTVRDAKGIIIGRVEGNPQYTKYTVKDRYEKSISTIQQQGVLKQGYLIQDHTNNQTLKTKGNPTKREYSLVKNGQIFANILKTSPETYKIEIKNRINTRLPILSSIVIDAIQRRKK
nr:hypothetical protein [Candidatus Freyarchaeota archaeon]